MESDNFKLDLDSVFERSLNQGMKYLINSGVNPKTNRKSLELSKKYSFVKCSFGLYPVDSIIEKVGSNVSDDYIREIEGFSVDSEIKWIEEHKEDCIALGEVGLDYQVAPDYKEEQKEVFLKAIDLARRLNKPLIIHSRKAEADALELLNGQSLKVILHCFSGKKSLIKKGIEQGYYFSVPPVIERLEHFNHLVRLVPLNFLLTETDSPYLSPIAGKRNDPSNIPLTLKKIAEIKCLSVEEVSRQIFNNAKEVFGL